MKQNTLKEKKENQDSTSEGCTYFLTGNILASCKGENLSWISKKSENILQKKEKKSE